MDSLALPSVGATLTICAYTSAVSTDSPVYLDTHPLSIAAALYAQAGIPLYDATSGS